jgi:hypothetical protein
MYAESDHLVLKYRNQQHRLRYVDAVSLGVANRFMAGQLGIDTSSLD